jgi:hypothetical protein
LAPLIIHNGEVIGGDQRRIAAEGPQSWIRDQGASRDVCLLACHVAVSSLSRPLTMLKSLLTPLRTRFEEAVSLRNDPPESVPESPEDFERDARIETMRMVVHSINAVEDDTARIDVSYCPILRVINYLKIC